LRHYGLLRRFAPRNDGRVLPLLRVSNFVARMSEAISGNSRAPVPDIASLIRATQKN